MLPELSECEVGNCSQGLNLKTQNDTVLDNFKSSYTHSYKIYVVVTNLIYQFVFEWKYFSVFLHYTDLYQAGVNNPNFNNDCLRTTWNKNN